MSVGFSRNECLSVRELALDLFKCDDCLAEDFRWEIATGSVSDDLLKETGCWDEAIAQMCAVE